MLLVGYDLDVAGGLGRVCIIVVITGKISSINPPLQILAWKSPPLRRQTLRERRGAAGSTFIVRVGRSSPPI